MRRKFDFYETSRWMVDELLFHINPSPTVYEPCNGRGAISRALPGKGIRIYTNDINPAMSADTHYDAADAIAWFPVDWVVTNPPFSLAFPILLHAYKHARKGVALLLRLSFLEPTIERQHFLHATPPTKLIVLPRYSFTENGKTDSVTCAWMVWEKDKNATKGVLVSKRRK